LPEGHTKQEEITAALFLSSSILATQTLEVNRQHRDI